MSRPAPTLKRARTGEQKAARRRAILDAAEQHFISAGFESFSMAELGRLANLAKGTLYLYFETREEVLLALFLEKLEAWKHVLVEAVGNRASDPEFARAFYATMMTDTALLPLLSRLDSVIEHNVPLETLIAAKRAMARLVEALAHGLAKPLQLTVTQTSDAVAGLSALLLGASQVDTGPRLDRRRLPADVKRMMTAFSSEHVFIVNACRILRGIRAGA